MICKRCLWSPCVCPTYAVRRPPSPRAWWLYLTALVAGLVVLAAGLYLAGSDRRAERYDERECVRLYREYTRTQGDAVRGRAGSYEVREAEREFKDALKHFERTYHRTPDLTGK